MASKARKSRKHSGTSKDSRPDHGAARDLVFFTDRDCGRIIPTFLRNNGISVVAHQENFADNTIRDPAWIPAVARQGWVIISHDYRMRYEDALDAMMENGARVFILKGSGTHLEHATGFVKLIDKVRRLLSVTRGPFVARVYQRQGRVEMWLDEKQWREAAAASKWRRRRK